MASVLLLDDALFTHQAMRVWFEAFLPGVELTSAMSVEVARKILQSAEFDLVICDDNVHGYGRGADLAQEIATSGRKVMILSSSERNRRENVPFVLKAADSTALEKTIRELLEAK